MVSTEKFSSPDLVYQNQSCMHDSSDSETERTVEAITLTNLESTHIQSVQVICDEDELSGEIDREYTGQFEGPEKTLEVCFRRAFDGRVPQSTPGEKEGLRTLSRSDLDLICKKARCTIMSKISNNYLDAYVLSESSLFVYNYMVVIKTCGTTTLLRCLALLIELGRTLGLELDWVGYSRKNFNFPDDQCFPHGSFTQELDYLYSHRKLCEKLNGNGYTLGPITDDHWFVFVADKTIRKNVGSLDNDRVLNIMMFDISSDVADLFYYDRYSRKVSEDETEEDAIRRISFEQTRAAGIDALYPGAIFDPRAFEPCGYSMNAILFQSYCTMHITPEEGSSYASFETNQKMTSYTSLIRNVVNTFKPKRFVMTMMADEDGLKEISDNPLTSPASSSKIATPMKSTRKAIYKRTTIASIKVEDDCCCMMGTWCLENPQINSYEERRRGMSFA
mmetsp:Transcript_15840/g.22553  ORF Transcript_15840/g.22553 Transcript_15840/m.22553 type:complete len:448 (-) Transcript_15840:220-1563(-)